VCFIIKIRKTDGAVGFANSLLNVLKRTFKNWCAFFVSVWKKKESLEHLLHESQ
jgi:hypothetical protein